MAAATAADRVLVSTHLSDVYSPLQTAAITISTSKPHVPFPPQASDDEPPPEHAQYASFFHSVQTGVILLRLIHNGLIVELVSLSTETPPIRFVFPYTVLPNPAVVLWDTRELHILAVTASGSLFRIVLPLQTPQQLWSPHMVNNWCREYHLKYGKEYLQALVQVHGTHSVALALTNGSLIRLDAENIGDKTSAGASVSRPFRSSVLIFRLKITGPRTCLTTIHFSRRSRPSFTKALRMDHTSSPLLAIPSQLTLAMYGPSLVIEPFVCGLRAVAALRPNYFLLRPRQVESHHLERALRQANPVFSLTRRRKSSSRSTRDLTSSSLFQHLPLLPPEVSSCYSAPRMTIYSWSKLSRPHVRARTVICRTLLLSMATSTPYGTVRARGQLKSLTYPCRMSPMNPKVLVGASYSILTNPT